MQYEIFRNQFGSSTGFMMKFLVLFLATAALASASLVGGKYIDIKEDGTIYIEGGDGKQIFITKHYGPNGNNLEIEVTGPNNFAKLYHFEFNVLNKNFDSQHDFVEAIFREYLGYVDEDTYQQLLYKIQKAVWKGYFDDQVLYIFQALVDDTKWNNLVSGQNYYGQVGEVLNKMTQQNKYGLGFYGKLFKGHAFNGQDYTKYGADYYYNILMKIFDKKVLQTLLIQEQINSHEMNGQYSYENVWDMLFNHEGIFDHQYVIQIINNPLLRTWFIQHGYFDKVVLDQILHGYKTEGVYNQYLIQRLFNTQVLKYFFINHGISIYDILGQTSYRQYYGNTFFNKGIHGYNALEKIILNPYWRNILVQYGVFQQNVLDQILDRYHNGGVIDHVLLKQLVNKEVLNNFLVQYGVVDPTMLSQFVENEYLGLNYLFKVNFFHQTPTKTYKHLFGVYQKVPAYYNYLYGRSYLHGQQYYGYNQGPYSYNKLYRPYGVNQQLY